MKTLLVLALLSIALPVHAQVVSYNHWVVEGTVTGRAEVQPYTAPGPKGAPMERVCLLQIRPYFHYEDVHHEPIDLWLQGGGVELCLDVAREYKDQHIHVEGYLQTVVLGGVKRTAAKVLSMSVGG